jgi:hypothetical protein
MPPDEARANFENNLIYSTTGTTTHISTPLGNRGLMVTNVSQLDASTVIHNIVHNITYHPYHPNKRDFLQLLHFQTLFIIWIFASQNRTVQVDYFSVQ